MNDNLYRINVSHSGINTNRTLILFWFLFIAISGSFSQNKFTDNLYIGLNYHTGFILPEYSFVNYITNDYTRSLDVTLVKKTYGKNYWEQLYNYPRYGFSFYYSTLGNDEIFGREIATTGFFQVDILSKKWFHLYNRTGVGMGYASRKFDVEDNYLNVAVGSHLNMHVNIRLGMDFKIMDKAEFNTGLSFDHFSNANLSEPNLGINSVSVYGGINYLFGEKSAIQTHKPEKHIRKFYKEFFISLGGKHTRALTSEVFFTSSLAAELHYELFRGVHLGTGADLFYDSSIGPQMKDKGESFRNEYAFQSGIHISQMFVYDRLSIGFQEGVYIYLKERIEDIPFYNRGIIQYRISDKLSVRLAMKSHLHILDFPELGIGFRM